MTYEMYSEIRDSMGLNDYKISKLTGIGRSTFSDWKAGRCKPKKDKLEKIRHALGLSMFEFYGDDLTAAADIIMNDFELNRMANKAAEVLDGPFIQLAKRIEALPADKRKSLEEYLCFLEQK